MCPAATNLALDGESMGNQLFRPGTKSERCHGLTFESRVESTDKRHPQHHGKKGRVLLIRLAENSMR
jgi:hypothetical protein